MPAGFTDSTGKVSRSHSALLRIKRNFVFLRIMSHQQLDKLAIKFMFPLDRFVGSRLTAFIQLTHPLKEYSKNRH